MGICKLCLQKRKLCKKSHIIPKFHYKFLYGSNNKLIYLNFKKLQVRYNSEYEGNILCQGCEGKILGKLDCYAAELINGNKTVFHLKQINGQKCLVLENSSNYDYSKFKLFLLSLLWRTSISSRPFFKTIKLQPQVEEDLRLMILNNKPGKPRKYPCLIILPPLVSTPNGGCGFIIFDMPTMSPRHEKKDEFEAYDLVIEGIHYIFIVSMPKIWNVAPSLEANKLIMGFASTRDQEKLLREIMLMIKQNKDTSNVLI